MEGANTAVREVNASRPAFDYWLFSTTWAPRFCCANAKICTAEGMWGASAFFTHGMWPSYYSAMNDGKTYPAFCKSQRDALAQSTSSAANFNSEVSRLRGRRLHEWSKHGTCTGLSPAEYFKAEDEVAGSPQLVLLQKHLQTLIVAHNQQHQLKTTQNADSSVPPPPPIISVRSLQSSLGGPERVAIKATNHCALEEITLCYAFASQYKAATGGSVGPQVNCPAHVLSSSRNSAVVQGCSSVVLDASSPLPAPPAGTGKGKGKGKEAGEGQGQGQGAGDHCAFVSKTLLKELRRT
jgi:ribonuclease I